MLTNQLAYEGARAHVAKMTEPCTNSAGGCVYLNEQGERCAIGGLLSLGTAKALTDEDFGAVRTLEIFRYAPRPRQTAETAEQAKRELSLDVEGGCDMGFLSRLQGCHDRYGSERGGHRKRGQFPAEAIADMDLLAQEYGLEVVTS